MDEFTTAYITAALWSTNDEHGEPLENNFSADDLAPETLAKIIADCAKFQADNAEHLAEENCLKFGPDFGPMGRAGHDFWLTRNGHGAGFWDGDWAEPAATILTEAAHSYKECDLCAGDDGKLYPM